MTATATKSKDSFSFKGLFGNKRAGKKSADSGRELARVQTAPPATDWKTWSENYRNGYYDFDNPPPPPQVDATLPRGPMGAVSSPLPKNEAFRQRAVQNLGVLEHARRVSSISSAQSDHRTASSVSSPASSSFDLEDRTAHVANTAAETTSRQQMPPSIPAELRPIIDDLVQKASDEFGMPLSMVALMDSDDLVLLADRGFKDVASVPRTDALCSHSVLKATHHEDDGLVVRDLDKDWRFKNVFPFRFYASAPISAPAAFGDERRNETYACGTFCIMDNVPREQWSPSQQERLRYYAKQASLELQKFREQKESESSATKVEKHNEFRLASDKALGQESQDNDTSLQKQLASLSVSGSEAPKRPGFKRSYTAETSSTDIATTNITPTFGRRVRRSGVHATQVSRLPPQTKNVLDLSTKLLGETLDLDFTYLVAVTIPDKAAGSEQVRLLSVHNMPIPAPLFDHAMHLETLTTPSHDALLLVNPESSNQDTDYSTGMLVKVAESDGIGYVLGGFSEDKRRVLNKSDFMFFRRFANDLAKHVKVVDETVKASTVSGL